MGLFASLVLSSCLLPPVTAPVADPFREPACPWCPGNRGLTYDVAAGTPVRAAAAGTVTFSGSVAGTFYVVVEHADGLRATYGELAGSHLDAGDVVVAGAIVGPSAGGLHFGLRRRRPLHRPGAVPRPARRAGPSRADRRHAAPTGTTAATAMSRVARSVRWRRPVRAVRADRTRSLPVR